MNPLLYILSLILATVGIVGLQVTMPDIVAIAFLWAAIVVSVFSAGWRISKPEQFMTIIVATLVAVYWIPLENGKGDRLYLLRLWWFILPVWVLLIIHSISRIRLFYQRTASHSPVSTP